MKVKKNDSKVKKKKNTLLSSANTGVKKNKKSKKVKKIENNEQVADAVKKQFTESGDGSVKKISRQEIWNTYLLAFRENEKLPKKQRQIIEFCTNKSTTPPKRKLKFLNFIRNCYSDQADVTNEQINELFDLILEKFNQYKSGNYIVAKKEPGSDDSSTSKVKQKSKEHKSPNSITPKTEPGTHDPNTSKLSNKKRKLKRASTSSNNEVEKSNKDNDTWTVVKSKKKKRQKVSTKLAENTGDDDDVDSD